MRVRSEGSGRVVKIPGAGAEARVWLENRRAKMTVSRCKRVPYKVYLRAIYTTYYLMVARDERNRSRKA